MSKQAQLPETDPWSLEGQFGQVMLIDAKEVHPVMHFLI